MKPILSRWQLLLAGVAALAAAGCESSNSGRNPPVYGPTQVNQARTSEIGTVQSVRPVIIQRDAGSRRSAGGRAGASVGRALATGQDPGAALAGATGSVVGEAVGDGLEQMGARHEGQEIEVLLDDGNIITVVQENNPPYIGGERVRLVRTGQYVEVVPDRSAQATQSSQRP